MEKVCVSENNARQRLDNFLLTHLTQPPTRSQIKRAIDEGKVLLNDEPAYKAGIIVETNDIIEYDFTNSRVGAGLTRPNEQRPIPQPIPLTFIYQDQHLAIVHKPRGMVVHPGAGCHSGTLLNGLLYHLAESASVMRGGIVHRLDKNTAGILVVAKTDVAMSKLSQMFERREVERVYLGIVEGELTGSGTISKNLVRDTRNRVLFTTHSTNGRTAITHYESLQVFKHKNKPVSLVRFKLETGRTHQIRVHMKSINRPLLGDPEYGSGGNGQMLEAVSLGFTHPITGEKLSFTVQPSAEFQNILNMSHIP